MRRLLAIALLVFVALAAASCGGKGEIDPIPTPLGKPEDGLILLSASSGLQSESHEEPPSDLVAVVGLPGALEPGVLVVVENPSGAFSRETAVGDDGSFATSLAAAANDTLRIYPRLRPDGRAPIDGPAIQRRVAPEEEGVTPKPPVTHIMSGPGAGGRAIYAWAEASGEALVRAAPETVEPGLEVVIGNTDRAAIVTVIAAADGSFEARLTAGRGDRLALFARWADAGATDPDGASTMVGVTVE
ncbi:hypothetical protein [Vulgatibacter sp.]|uniref:hypothetical protein n=1 Tax=Vulgatibacter sp. TaxID=1971226 RepID=UPI0035650D92